MKVTIKNKTAHIAENFMLNTVVSLEEITNFDMIYIYHHLHLGATVKLTAEGTNVKGDLRYKATFKNFVIGYVTIGGPVKSIYEGLDELESTVVSMKKQKFLPIRALDLSVQATKMRMVS